MDRWRLLEIVLQALVFPLEALYFIVTNDWTQSMIRVVIEVVLDLTMNSVLGGASVAVATIMLLREMGTSAAVGASTSGAGDAACSATETVNAKGATCPSGMRTRMPLIITTKTLETTPSSASFVRTTANGTKNEDLKTQIRSDAHKFTAPPFIPDVNRPRTAAQQEGTRFFPPVPETATPLALSPNR